MVKQGRSWRSANRRAARDTGSIRGAGSRTIRTPFRALASGANPRTPGRAPGPQPLAQRLGREYRYAPGDEVPHHAGRHGPLALTFGQRQNERRAVPSQVETGGLLRPGEGMGGFAPETHHFAGRLHLRSEQRVAKSETLEGQHGHLRRDALSVLRGKRPERVHRDACDNLCGVPGIRDTAGLRDERNGSACPRVDLDQIDAPALDGELDVHQPDHAEGAGEQDRLPLDLRDHPLVQGVGRKHAGAVPGMNSGGFDMLQDAGDPHVLAIGDRIDIALDGIAQIAFDEHRPVVGDLHGRGDVVPEFRLVRHDAHGPAAEHVGRPDHDRIADLLGCVRGLSCRTGDAVRRLPETEPVDELPAPLPVLAEIDRVRRGSENGDPRLLDRLGEGQRRLAAELDHRADQLSAFLLLQQDLDDILARERLEIEPVGGVVVGRHRLRIAVDHDRLVADLGEAHAGMDAAIIELDPLADPIGSAPQHRDLAPVRDIGLAFRRPDPVPFVGAVHVGRPAAELRRAGIDALYRGRDPGGSPEGPDPGLAAAGQGCDARIRQARLLEGQQVPGIACVELSAAKRVLDPDGLADAVDEPPVDAAFGRDVGARAASPQGVRDQQDPHRRADLESLQHALGAPFRARLVEAVEADLERAQRLLHRLGEVAPDRHRLAHRLHLRAQDRSGIGKLDEVEARYLGHDIVQRGLEARRSSAGDLVGDLVQRVSDGKLGRDPRNREPGRLGGQGRRPRYPGVHLDQDLAAVTRVDRELDVRPSGLDPDLAHAGDGAIPHRLELLVGQGQCGRDGDAVAGVHAHRIDVLDRAHDDGVVGAVPHHLQLELLPAQQRFLDEHRRRGRGFEPGRQQLREGVDAIGDASSRAAQREGGAQDGGEAHALQGGQPFFLRGDHCRARAFDADLPHRIAEELAVFRLADHVGSGAEELDVPRRQIPAVRQGERHVQRNLTPHGRQDGEGLARMFAQLLLDDGADGRRRHGLDVGRVGGLRVGHDRRRVGVDQDHPDSVLAKRLAGLRARIVELAGLTDDDRSGSQDHHVLQVCAFRHVLSSLPAMLAPGRPRLLRRQPAHRPCRPPLPARGEA